MTHNSAVNIHWSFRVICIIFLIWNVLGAMNFLWQVNADAPALASLPETHQAVIAGRPVWATAGFALGVFAGVLGCLLLLLKKASAYILFIVSLFGITITMIHTLEIARSTISFSPVEFLIMILMPLLVAIFLVWYARYVKREQWIS